MADHQFSTPPNANGYARGCRCSECTEAKYSAYRIYRKRYRDKYPEKRREERRRYNARHPDKTKAQSKMYRANNPEKCREYEARKYHKHKTRILQYKRRYRAQYKDVIRDRYRTKYAEQAKQYKRTEKGKRVWYAALANNRAMRRNAKGTTTADQLQGRWSLFGNKCYLCGDKPTATDHVIPLSRGGSHWPSNQRPVCKSCNSKKGCKKLSEYLVTNQRAFAHVLCAA